MGFKKTGTRSVREVKGYWFCDRCGERMTREDRGNAGSIYIYGHVSSMQYGRCCSDDVVRILRDSGFKFRIRKEK